MTTAIIAAAAILLFTHIITVRFIGRGVDEVSARCDSMASHRFSGSSIS